MDDPNPPLDDGLARLAEATAPPEVRRIAELLPAFYGQLKHIAHRSRARVGAGYTLQTTALVPNSCDLPNEQAQMGQDYRCVDCGPVMVITR